MKERVGKFRGQSGFERVQLVVVCCILAAISFLVVPAFIRGRAASQEEKMKAALRLFHSANQAYRMAFNQGYAASIGALTQPTKGRRYLAPGWDTLTQYGYRLTYKTDRMAIPSHFALVAERKPALWLKPASLCVDERGLIFRDDSPLRFDGEAGAVCTRGIIVV